MVKERASLGPDAGVPKRSFGPRRTRSGRSHLPNFLVIGAMKSGTTSLFHYLQAHPQIFMSPLKEVDFFAEEGNWDRGLDWYRRQFGGAGPSSIAIGEASTSYTKYPEYQGVAERIASCLPDVRLIYIVRDPIERIRSHYQHRALIGAERTPFESAVLQDPRYVDCSRYALQIEQYMRFFPREGLFVATSEELRSLRGQTMSRIYRFLGVDDEHVPDTLDREFYKTEERAGYPPYVWWLRRMVKRYVPAGKRAKEFIDLVVPSSIGRIRGDVATTAPREPSPVSDPLRSQLEDRLRDDVRMLREYMKDGFDGWGIA